MLTLLKKMSNSVLIVAGGGITHLAPFEKAAKKLGVDVLVAPLSSLEYETGDKKIGLKISGRNVKEFDTVYIRLVGGRFEEAALLINYCIENKIRIVDSIFERKGFIRLPLAKSIESKLLTEAGIPTPKTYFGKLNAIVENAPEIFGFPFVIKGTTGKQGNAVWSPRSEEEIPLVLEKIKKSEKAKDMKFMAQEFIKSSQRSRIFVIGEKAVTGITRPTRWRRRFIEKEKGGFPEGKREVLSPVPEDQGRLAVEASKALGIEIAGVDVLKEDKTGKIYILEVNSAPSWKSVKKDTGLKVEEEILKYLISL